MSWRVIQGDTGEPLQRLGKRGRMVESIFSKLPRPVRTAEVFLAVAAAAGIDEKRARARWNGWIAFLEADKPRGR